MSNRIFFGYLDGRLRYVPVFMGGADDWIGLAEPTTINKRVDAETVIFGTTTLYRERMQIAGASSSAIAPVSATSGLLVEFANTTITASLVAASTLTASLTAGSTIGVILTSASITTASSVGVSFTTASTVSVVFSTATTGRVELAAATTLTASLTAGSTIGVVLTSASITTASSVGVSFSTASTVSVVITTATTGRVEIAAGSTITASLTAGSTLTASLTAGSTVGVVLTTASVVRVESGSTVLAVTGTSNVSGSTVISYPQITLAQGTTVLTPSFASLSFATSGAQTIVSSVANSVVRVLQWNLVAASTNSLQWRSGTSAISGMMAFAANGGISVPYSPVGLFQGTSGSALNLFSETATSVGGSIVYLQSTSL